MRILKKAEINQLANVDDLRKWVRECLIATSDGKVLLPLRWGMELPGDLGVIGMMPGYLANEGTAGVKLVSLVPPARRKGSSHLGLMILYDEDGLVPSALLDGAHITAIRTSAASAAATDELAREDAETLAILGTGEQAEAHAIAIANIRSLREIRIWGRDLRKAQSLARSLSDRGYPMCACSSVLEAVENADIVCTTTSSPEPMLNGEALSKGVHINLVGSSHAKATEVASSVLSDARIFIDYWGSAKAQAGELIREVEIGNMSWDDIGGEIGEVLAGRAEGRQSREQRTIYKSLGIAAQDIIVANRLLQRARSEKIGTVISWDN